jgi:hypothetical protein
VGQKKAALLVQGGKNLCQGLLQLVCQENWIGFQGTLWIGFLKDVDRRWLFKD